MRAIAFLFLSILSLMLVPAAAAEEERTCENGLVGVGPQEADVEAPTGTTARAEIVRCWTWYDEPAYLAFHRSANATAEDELTGAYARAHASEYAGGINNWDNGTNWSYSGERVIVEAGDGDAALPEAEAGVSDHRTSVNGEHTHMWHVRARLSAGVIEHETDERFPDPYRELYDTTIGPTYEPLLEQIPTLP